MANFSKIWGEKGEEKDVKSHELDKNKGDVFAPDVEKSPSTFGTKGGKE
jgi:hypothetical protein